MIGIVEGIEIDVLVMMFLSHEVVNNIFEIFSTLKHSNIKKHPVN